MGHLVKLVIDDMGGKAMASSEFREAVASKLTDVKFCDVMVEALTAAHRERRNANDEWSKRVAIILSDASNVCGGSEAFPSLRESLASFRFKMKHSRFIEALIQLLSEGDRVVAAKILLRKCKAMTLSSADEEDHAKQQCTSSEVFGGVCRGLLGCRAGEKKASESWSIMLPFLEEVLDAINGKAIDDWSDGLRFGIHGVGTLEAKPLLEMLVGKVLTTLRDEHSGSGGASTGGGKGFAKEVKWIRLSYYILVELTYVRPEVRLLEAYSSGGAYGNDQVQAMGSLAIVEKEPSDQKKVLEETIDLLLPKLLGALDHPFSSCKLEISAYLLMLGGIASACFSLDINTTNCHILVEKFEESLRQGAVTETKKNVRKTLCFFISKLIQMGDVERYYRPAVLPLLPSLFSCLEVDEDDDADSSCNENGNLGPGGFKGGSEGSTVRARMSGERGMPPPPMMGMTGPRGMLLPPRGMGNQLVGLPRGMPPRGMEGMPPRGMDMPHRSS